MHLKTKIFNFLKGVTEMKIFSIITISAAILFAVAAVPCLFKPSHGGYASNDHSEEWIA